MKRWWIGLTLAMLASAAMAANYEVSVTRDGSNLYRADGRDLLIHTRYCYEYVYYEDVLLRMWGSSGEIIFLDSGGKCDVTGVYARNDQSAGRYTVTVSHEDDDWYEVWGTDIYIKTEMCLSLALGQEALLRLNAYGGGNLVFLDDGDSCMVDGVYSKLSL